jgi:hypothetical protein
MIRTDSTAPNSAGHPSKRSSVQTAARTALTVLPGIAAAVLASGLVPGLQPTASADDWLVHSVWTNNDHGQKVEYGQALLTGLRGQDQLFLLACDHRKDGLWVVVDLRWGKRHVQLVEKRDNPKLACRPQRGEDTSALQRVTVAPRTGYTLQVCLHGLNRPPRNCSTQQGRTS